MPCGQDNGNSLHCRRSETGIGGLYPLLIVLRLFGKVSPTLLLGSYLQDKIIHPPTRGSSLLNNGQ